MNSDIVNTELLEMVKEMKNMKTFARKLVLILWIVDCELTLVMVTPETKRKLFQNRDGLVE